MHTQRDTRQWIRAVCQHMNMSPSQLATASGVAASTLTRYLNDPSGATGVSQKTLDAIAVFSGVAPHHFPGKRGSAFAEPDAEPYEAGPGETDPAHQAVLAWTKGVNGRDAWRMKGWGLDLSGVLPGDVLIIDQNRRAKAGDIVCAQIADWQTGKAETVLRLYEAPYIMTNSAKLGPSRPMQVDDENISIRGVAVAVLRFRH
jgi:transcriptional regulator with XRE-family HTH domain